MGRPLTLTKKLREEICGYLRDGVPFLSNAAAMAGVSYATVKRWMKQGKDARKAGDKTSATRPFRRFRAEVLRAREAGKGRLVHEVVKSRHWKAKFAVLSMTDARYRKRNDTHLQGSLGVRAMTEEESLAALSKLLKVS